MGKKVISILVFIVLLGVVPAVAASIGTDNDKVKAVASPSLDNLLTGFNKGNYAQYSKDFDATLREAIPEKKFQQIREEILKKLGPYKSKEYLGFLNQQAYTVVLWKGAFADTKDNVLIKLVLSKRENKVVVVGLWFQ